MSRSVAYLPLILALAYCGCTNKPAPTAQTTGNAVASVAPTSVANDVEKSKPAEATSVSSDDDFAKEEPVSYRVRQIVRLDDIKEDAKNVRMWVSIPDDEQNQRLLDLKVVSAPGKWSIVQDEDRRARFVKLEVEEPKASAIDVEVEFSVTRNPVYVTVDPKKAGSLSEDLRQAFADELATDAPHMEVTDKIRAIADEVCKDEKNLAKQASLLMNHVAKLADHYSYSTDPDMPKCGIGDAQACLDQRGGCCTDLHSLFIALARARGIPARLSMGYRLQEKNRDKLVDPGYRCWVEYFIPNYGWVSSDIVEGDAPAGLGFPRWSSGLTARRVFLNRGRDYKLASDLAEGRVNHMSIAYAEIDGVPARLLPEGELKAQITRQVQFSEVGKEPAESIAAASR
jgi:transglutaminase-like putative cysteine protease